MNDRFESPVLIVFGHPARVQRVTSIARAAEFLLDPLWPLQGPCHLTACAAIIDWSEARGQASTTYVRRTFREAAREAGVLMETALQ